MAVEALEGTEASLQLAGPTSGSGRCLTRRSDLAAARRHLAIALDLAHRCGATSLIDRHSARVDHSRRPSAAGGADRKGITDAN